MAGILGDIVKGLSELTGTQDDPDLKIFTSQSEISDIKKKIEAVYAKVGKTVMESEQKLSYPMELEELKLLMDKLSTKQGEIDQLNKAKQHAKDLENTCPNCGKINQSGVSFCVECGTELRTVKHFCPNCGNEVVEGAKFCPGCGTKIE